LQLSKEKKEKGEERKKRERRTCILAWLRARSIKRAFTIDQRSIEVDHELKTVVTRKAWGDQELFARLCKYLPAERLWQSPLYVHIGGLYITCIHGVSEITYFSR